MNNPLIDVTRIAIFNKNDYEIAMEISRLQKHMKRKAYFIFVDTCLLENV